MVVRDPDRRITPLPPPQAGRPPVNWEPRQQPSAGSGIMAGLTTQPAIPPQAPPAPAPPVTGPYQGVAGSEAQNPGRPRQPHAGWANPSDPNYERRNYYLHPVTGEVVAREAGYYNPENPWDTGREGEANDEFGRTYGYGADAIAPFERRMDEPGITPWGPGGKSSPPGSFQGVGAPGGGAASGPQVPRGLEFSRALLAAGQESSPYGGDAAQQLAGGGGDPQTSLASLLQALLGKVPGGGSSGSSRSFAQ
jgi:hypothetical protein